MKLMRNLPLLKTTLFLTAMAFLFSSCTPTTYSLVDTIETNRKCKGDCINGKGTSFFEHKDTKILYTGSWKNSKENGNGTIYYFNGNKKYEGAWKDGFMHGQGQLFDETTGNLVYKGQFVNGLKEGAGTLIDEQGNTYSGQFAKDHKEGNGQYTYADGTNFEGIWSQNVLVGKNTLTVNGAPANNGKVAPLEFIESRCLVPGDCKNGIGTFVYDDGRKYTGQFQEAKRHGKGISYDSKGRKAYEGSWANNKKHGSGVLYYPTGEKMYVGTWFENRKHAEGIIYRKDGTIHSKENYNQGARTDHQLAQDTLFYKCELGSIK